MFSTSLVKPKVRARAMSRLYWPVAKLEAVVRFQPGPFQLGAFAFAHFDRALDAQKALGRLLQLDAGALQQVDKRGRRAIQDGDFFGGDVDVEVVQSQAGAGRHQVLDGVDLGGARVATGRDGGGHAGVAHRLGAHGDVGHLGQVDPAEHDARVGRGRAQGDFDALAAVQANAYGAGQGLQGALLQHGAHYRGSAAPAFGQGHVHARVSMRHVAAASKLWRRAQKSRASLPLDHGVKCVKSDMKLRLMGDYPPLPVRMP